jgi:Kef-type K+ transport system membrane component KefB
MDEYNPILTLLVQIGLILALSRLMGAVFERLHQPQVIGEMVAGIMLGPSLLGLWAPSVYQTLFPRESIAYLHLLSQLGVILFLFLVGLEFDPELIRRRGREALVISASSIATPFAVGVALAYWLYPRVFAEHQRVSFLATSLFMGAAISVTAFPVLARILSERNLQRTTVGAISLTGAAVNDVLAWCLLAFVVAVAQYDPRLGPAAALLTIGLATLYVLFMLFAMRPFLRRIEGLYDRRGRLSKHLMALIFLLVLASAYATERIGIHALFGAFLIGCVMPKRSQFVGELSEKLEDFTVVFLLPIFFAYAGLSTDLSPRGFGGHLWGYTLVIVLAACAGKIGGSAVAARGCGQGWRESLAIGALMNTRGLMELIILTIGLSLGVINDDVYTMMVVMALVTTAMTAPLLYWLYPAARYGRAEAEAKAPQAARPPRVFSVLVPVSLPESGAALARVASTMIGSEPRAGIILALHLRRASDQDVLRGALEDSTLPARESDEALTPLLSEARARQVPVETMTFVSRDVANDIADVAAAMRVALVLIGFHKPVFGKTILGGTVHRVMSQAETDVAVFVDRGIREFKKILVPYLGGSHDRLAMELAHRMARNTKAEVTVLHVVPPERAGRLDAKSQFDRIFTEPQTGAAATFKIVQDRSPAGAVLRAAREYDLVVIGVSEEWGLESHLFGWRPERIARESNASLLIVRRHHEPAPPATPAAQVSPSTVEAR